ncbi:MAG TPA: hypothetical protein VKD72_37115 [Gemmataceae bacterium]|nr:hypothetical protein [Gemmataceae bacterium]
MAPAHLSTLIRKRLYTFASRLARARNRVAPTPHACEQAPQTLAGLPGLVRLADTKQTR